MYSEKKKAQGPWCLPVVTQLITHKAESPLSQAHNLSHPFCIFNMLAMTHPTPHIVLNLPYTIHSYHYLEVQFSSHHDAWLLPPLMCLSSPEDLHLLTFLQQLDQNEYQGWQVNNCFISLDKFQGIPNVPICTLSHTQLVTLSSSPQGNKTSIHLSGLVL